MTQLMSAHTTNAVYCHVRHALLLHYRSAINNQFEMRSVDAAYQYDLLILANHTHSDLHHSDHELERKRL
jgi:hypothetical protein